MVGKRITAATLSKTDVLRKVSKPALLRFLRGSRITAITRRAKHAVFHFAGGRRMVIRLGMTGALVVYNRPLTPEEAKYSVLVLDLTSRSRFVYRDIRRFGAIYLLDQAAWTKYDARLGPEPLDAAFTPEVDPSRPASSLAAREVRALHRAIVAILERAIKAEGTTFRDYRTGTGQPGSYQLRLNVYGRGGEPCRRCGHRLVTTHSIDARATTMCPWCQG